jgi:cobalt-zinc-cadmium efflux system membrane fusion protein
MKIKALWSILVIGIIGASAVLWHFKIIQKYMTFSAGQNPSAVQDENDPEAQEGEKVVRLEEGVLKEFGVETGIAGPGKLQVHITLAGEISFNSDRLAHIAPRVPGVVREVRKNIGDSVRAGEVLAVIESRELADSKAAYLAANERLILAQANFTREEGLWQKKITPDKDYRVSKQALAEASIALRSAEQKLHALGFPEHYLKEIPTLPEDSFTRFEITAPLDGTVVAKHIVLGEVLKEDSDPFLIADLSSVWVELKIHQEDLATIRPGQTVLVSAGDALHVEGAITLVSSTLSEATRTALARIVIPNPDGRWRPGLFVTGRVVAEEVAAGVVVPKDALVRLDGQSCVFVEIAEGFTPQAVTIGRSNDIQVEITAGLKAGQRYVTRGAFTLKSELNKPSEE